jgi:hypothetical protein
MASTASTAVSFAPPAVQHAKLDQWGRCNDCSQAMTRIFHEEMRDTLAVSSTDEERATKIAAIIANRNFALQNLAASPACLTPSAGSSSPTSAATP